MLCYVIMLSESYRCIINEKLLSAIPQAFTVYDKWLMSYERGGAKVQGRGKPRPMKVCMCVYVCVFLYSIEFDHVTKKI